MVLLSKAPTDSRRAGALGTFALQMAKSIGLGWILAVATMATFPCVLDWNLRCMHFK